MKNKDHLTLLSIQSIHTQNQWNLANNLVIKNEFTQKSAFTG